MVGKELVQAGGDFSREHKEGVGELRAQMNNHIKKTQMTKWSIYSQYIKHKLCSNISQFTLYLDTNYDRTHFVKS